MKKPASISSRSPSGERTTTSPQSDRQWTFLAKHAAVLPHLARHPDETMRSVAATLGLTERPAAMSWGRSKEVQMSKLREEIGRRGRQGYRAGMETGGS